jgi:hypothetical protein
VKVTEQPDPRIIFLCQPTYTLRNAKTFACFLGDLELFFSAVPGVARRSVPSLSRLIEYICEPESDAATVLELTSAGQIGSRESLSA